MYKFIPDEDEDREYRKQAITDASDPASTPASPQPKSTKEMLNERLASMLDPQLQERYNSRRQEAIDQQDQNYQGPEAIQALKDGQDFRALQTGLQKAANKFGSFAGDGGQQSDFGETAKAFDASASQNFQLKDKAYQSAIKAEDDAYDGLYESQMRPLELQRSQLSVDEKQSDYDWNEAPVNEYTKNITESALEKAGMGGKVPWDKVKNRDLERNPFLKNVVAQAKQAQAGKPTYQKLLDSDGVVRLYAIQPDGTKQVVGDAGFAGQVRTDPVTGGIITINPNRGSKSSSVSGSGSSRPQSSSGAQSNSAAGEIPDTSLRNGETPKQRDIRVDLQKKAAEEKIKNDSKADEAADAAVSAQYKAGEVSSRLAKLRTEAGLMSGPVGGRVTEGLNSLGFSAGKGADKLNQQTKKMISDYIKETTGATASAEEMKRLEANIPSVTDSDSLFKNKSEGLEQQVQGLVNEKLAARNRRQPSAQPQTKPSSPGQPKSWRDF